MTSSPCTFCGLDFGTSNSSIGRFVGAAPQLVEIQPGRVSVPTAIFFSFEDGRACFGQEAVASYLRREDGRFMRALKGLLGSSLVDETTLLKGRRLRFLDIIAMFVTSIRTAAGNPDAVVMGRPVRFVDDDEEADRNAEEQLRTAARQAGFTTVEFQFEPIAAALDYERGVTGEQLAFVVDIGGGTSDFSIVRVSPERRHKSDRRSDILGFAGVHIGGTDFDKHLELQTVMPHLGMGSKLRHKNMEPPRWWYHDLATWHRINFMYDPKVATDIGRVRRDAREPDKLGRLLRVIDARKGHALLGSIEQVKIALS
ncbi:MAG TPA: Hsp70 family protein, partial [Hyphomicrobiaceae bacterium]|nr:Hsp70 family protein [Hyphomicrobiaceae bacterium]